MSIIDLVRQLEDGDESRTRRRGRPLRFTLRRTVAPTGPTLDRDADIKPYLRITGSAQNAVLDALIAAAWDRAEEYMRRSLLPQTWEIAFDQMPCGPEVTLPRPPLREVTSITWYSRSNEATTLDPSTYTVDVGRNRVVLNDGQYWPVNNVRSFRCLVITYQAGYDSAAHVPDRWKQGIRRLIATNCEVREDVITMGNQAIEITDDAKKWLDQVPLL